jgi:hypothetical protein
MGGMMEVHFDIIKTFSPKSRVWIYPSSRRLEPAEVQMVNNQISDFCRQWTAHSQKLQATGWVDWDRFLFLVVDETMAGASGCSIDTSLAFIQKVGKALQVDFLDRLTFYFLDKEGSLQSVHKKDLSDYVSRGIIQPDTLFMDTLVSNKEQLDSSWLVPYRHSWHSKIR